MMKTLIEKKKMSFGSTAIAVGVGAVLGVIATSVVTKGGSTPSHVSSKIQEKIKGEFPNTEFVHFEQTKYGLIEAMTSSNILYFDQDAKAVIVGELLDLETKTPVTIERRRNLKEFADMKKLAGGGAAPAAAAPAKAAPAAKPRQAAPNAAGKTVDLSVLSEANYIVHNKGAGEVLYVVSDFNCGFCKRLHDELAEVTDFEIREIPVRFLRDESTLFGAHSLCADDPVQAASDIFAGKRSDIKTCDEGVDAVGFNTAWASENGMTGTPTLITADGKVSSGYRELAQIRAFVGS